jgi:hypothetical protein
MTYRRFPLARTRSRPSGSRRPKSTATRTRSTKSLSLSLRLRPRPTRNLSSAGRHSASKPKRRLSARCPSRPNRSLCLRHRPSQSWSAWTFKPSPNPSLSRKRRRQPRRASVAYPATCLRHTKRTNGPRPLLPRCSQNRTPVHPPSSPTAFPPASSPPPLPTGPSSSKTSGSRVASSTASSSLPTCSPLLRLRRRPSRSGRGRSGRSRPRSLAPLPMCFFAWAPPPPSCSCSGPRSPRHPSSSPAGRRTTTGSRGARSTGSTRLARASLATGRAPFGISSPASGVAPRGGSPGGRHEPLVVPRPPTMDLSDLFCAIYLWTLSNPCPTSTSFRVHCIYCTLGYALISLLSSGLFSFLSHPVTPLLFSFLSPRFIPQQLIYDPTWRRPLTSVLSARMYALLAHYCMPYNSIPSQK